MPHVEQAMTMAKAPSISVGILQDGEIIFTRSIGLRDLERNLKANSKTSYLLASCSKMVTSSALNILQSEEELSLKDTIQPISRLSILLRILKLAKRQLWQMQDGIAPVLRIRMWFIWVQTEYFQILPRTTLPWSTPCPLPMSIVSGFRIRGTTAMLLLGC